MISRKSRRKATSILKTSSLSFKASEEKFLTCGCSFKISLRKIMYNFRQGFTAYQLFQTNWTSMDFLKHSSQRLQEKNLQTNNLKRNKLIKGLF